MHVIAAKTIRLFADNHPDSRKPLMQWLSVVEDAVWENIKHVLVLFPNTDQAKVGSGRTIYVFNIKGGHYRLIAAIHFNRRKVFILRFLTHAEYSKNAWKAQL